MTIFFSFTLVDSVVPENAIIYKQIVTQDQAIQLIKEGVKPCLEQSWQALMNIASHFGIATPIPAASQIEELSVGDSFLVLNNQSGYTEDVTNAKFKFTLWTRLA
jgi:hypothetical protein